MKTKTILVTAASVLFLQMSTSAQAFECPLHLAKAQAAINTVSAEMKDMQGQMPKEQMALVHALLDDAKMWLNSARHNHEKPRGAFDHARSLAKADSALGYAQAADRLHWDYMKK